MQYNFYHYVFRMQASGGKVDLIMSSNQHAASDASIADGNPHVLVATWSTSDNTGRLYVDGTLQAATLTSTTIEAAGGDFNAVATQANGTGVIASPFTGNIPVVGCYNTKLGTSDLATLHSVLKTRAGI